VDGKVGKFGASLYTRLVSFARIEPMLNPILVEPTILHKEFISPPFTKKEKKNQTNQHPKGTKWTFSLSILLFHFSFNRFFNKKICSSPIFSYNYTSLPSLQIPI
jgi:hypothetical protein